MPFDSMKKYDKCPVCSSTIKQWRLKKVGEDNYEIDKCPSCGYAFINPRPSMSFLMDFYSNNECRVDNATVKESKSLNSVLLREQDDPNTTVDARRMIDSIKKLHTSEHNNKFLDVGCGYGFFSKQALDSGFDVISLELGGNEREISEEMTGLRPQACSYEEFECSPNSLSVILMSQILEHVFDVNQWIEKAHTSLVHDGILAIALPNYSSIFRKLLQENDPFICPPEHLNFFSPMSLTRLLENHGFVVEKIQWVSNIPKRTFEKRLTGFLKPLVPAVSIASSASLKLVDALHLGMMINVYGRKAN
ncbi:bifunctional 3-demethylubiquinone-9 3-methyltransferase/ 2-octaprenyl-6-hydroxy phenol methylase [Mariprofundus micogutta]|uniref:Bifunctional 3-demethylubiquinone-9 3-methyltransferase/ 2-octaprenyl-6-hydroxy phenol methylase n=1 Tax=Mariprofundus micogutta TaxID=1921010 RepID=A0A1L8CLT9_9PROT|nr:class I SAM-dependent methyltransferase [Mariprofundus micogutta]GAV19890.1 bifunctional 3-demethylubiquinone-9 3-methyltransferase/ 2-octaprenyl-6-hydroxy phenol methylase [Mariprofundus micogutta]